jgi:hypothetical protein
MAPENPLVSFASCKPKVVSRYRVICFPLEFSFLSHNTLGSTNLITVKVSIFWLKQQRILLDISRVFNF